MLLLLIRIRDPGIYLTLDPGSGKEKFGSGINMPGSAKVPNRTQMFRAPTRTNELQEGVCPVQYEVGRPGRLKFNVADPDPGSRTFLTLDTGSGMEKFGSGKNIPGSTATLPNRTLLG